MRRIVRQVAGACTGLLDALRTTLTEGAGASLSGGWPTEVAARIAHRGRAGGEGGEEDQGEDGMEGQEEEEGG